MVVANKMAFTPSDQVTPEMVTLKTEMVDAANKFLAAQIAKTQNGPIFQHWGDLLFVFLSLSWAQAEQANICDDLMFVANAQSFAGIAVRTSYKTVTAQPQERKPHA